VSIYTRFLVCAALAFLPGKQTGFAQSHADIELALGKKDAELADKLIQQKVNSFYRSRNADSLNNYLFFAGRAAELQAGPELAVKTIERHIARIKTLSPKPVSLRQTYLQAAEYYAAIGKNDLAYMANKEAYRYTLLIPGEIGELEAIIENNMGTIAQRMADLNLSQQHYKQAMAKILKSKQKNFETLFSSYNAMGTVMWYASKLDSAVYYFNKAIQTTQKLSDNPYNKFYRPAIIHNNIAGVYGLQGKSTEAIAEMKQSIKGIARFIASKEPHVKKTTARTFQLEATDNLAGIYKELGDYKQAHVLLLYSYQQKQKLLSKGDPALFISQILLGQLYYAMRDYSESLRYLNTGLQQISKSDGDYLFWQADACNTLALLNDKLNNKKEAAYYFEKADNLYEQSLQGEYDNIYLEFLQNAAQFFAENKMSGKALEKAGKAYKYTLKVEGGESLLTFYQLVNMAEVHCTLGRYQPALSYSNQALAVVNRIMRSSTNLLDSVQIQLKKPRAILVKAKAQYELAPVKNPESLKATLLELNQALSLLEKRKVLISGADDVGILLADHSALLDFIKKITLDLYISTGNQAYADKLVSLHESALYTRIRSRIEQAGNIKFAGLPPDILETEGRLKQAVINALSGEGSHYVKMQAYLHAVDKWNLYLGQLKIKHPDYYKMRYASIFKPVADIQARIPEGSTLVRYFFTGGNLLVLVADRKKRKLFKLNSSLIEQQIAAMSSNLSDAHSTGETLYALYKQLWAPISKSISNKRIILIPDGVLYNLNFELLTPQKISSFAELKTKSLLAKYTISYQYSAFLPAQVSGRIKLKNNFVGFVPGFSDRIKSDYLASNTDPIDIDRTYMNLLPQPFTAELAVKVQKLMGGNLFMNQQSTLRKFRNYAGKHKIIHIGTHAESNDQHPEFSRLLFTKGHDEKEKTNSLYLFDIYNCDLSSELAVLAACESGKPGYQDGEGMISLAHAFNYAGSESMVTGLWKIDEQASAKILELFYNYLLKGLSKDEALRQAKLSYLSTSTGRALSPEYWAGLVLMGNTEPVEIDKPWFSGSMQWIGFGLLAIAFCVASYFLVRKSNPLKQIADI